MASSNFSPYRILESLPYSWRTWARPPYAASRNISQSVEITNKAAEMTIYESMKLVLSNVGQRITMTEACETANKFRFAR